MLIWDDGVDILLRAPLVEEQPNDGLRFYGGAWAQRPAVNGSLRLQNCRSKPIVTVQLEPEEVCLIGQTYLRNLRTACRELVEKINRGCSERVIEQEIGKIKRRFECDDDLIKICLLQTESPMDMVRRALLKEQPAWLQAMIKRSELPETLAKMDADVVETGVGENLIHEGEQCPPARLNGTTNES